MDRLNPGYFNPPSYRSSTDATYVAPKPFITPRDEKPQSPSPVFASDRLHDTFSDISGSASNLTPPDATVYKPKTRPEKSEPEYRPHQTYLTQGHPEDFREKKLSQAEQNIQDICQSDPIAAEINGYRNFGTADKPDWSKIGPDPLSTAALMYGGATPAGQLFFTAFSTGKAVADPSPKNLFSLGVNLLTKSPLEPLAKAAEFTEAAEISSEVGKREEH